MKTWLLSAGVSCVFVCVQNLVGQGFKAQTQQTAVDADCMDISSESSTVSDHQTFKYKTKISWVNIKVSKCDLVY